MYRALEHRYIYIEIDPYVSRPIETIDNEASMYIYLCARVIDMAQCIVTSRRICLCMFFFTLKDCVPIDWRYMTDRLQRFELKNLYLCSTEETKSPTSWMPCRG